MNTTKVKITGYNGDIPIKIMLQKFCLMRYAEKIGDVEIINNTQLGRLKYQNVEFEECDYMSANDWDSYLKHDCNYIVIK